MSTSTSGATLSFSGLATGIDTASIVAALMKIERLPIDRVQTQKKELAAKQGVVQEINGLLGKLRDAAAEMYKPGALAAKTAAAADPAIVSPSAGASAASGTYNVVVTALAHAHTAASATAPPLVAGESLDITVGGEVVSVAVEAGDTLQAFADRINASDDAGASASVVNGRLVLISRESGSAGAITLGGSAAAGFGFATTQAAQDASATINGLVVTSSGNTIAGAINGVDLTLGTVGSTTVTVGADRGASVTKAQGFVDAYNAVMRNVKLATSYDAATKKAGTLQGDQTMSSLASQLRGIAGSAVAGLGGAHDSLAQIGITSSRDGALSLDAAKFTAALTADPGAVSAVFGADDGVEGSAATDGVARRIQAFADSFAGQVLSSRLTGFTGSLSRLDEKITSLESVMTLREQRLKLQFAAMEAAVAQFQAQGTNLSSQLARL